MSEQDYSGKWIALRNNKVVSSAKDFTDLIKNLKPTEIPSLTFAKIPQRGTVCVM